MYLFSKGLKNIDDLIMSLNKLGDLFSEYLYNIRVYLLIRANDFYSYNCLKVI